MKPSLTRGGAIFAGAAVVAALAACAPQQSAGETVSTLKANVLTVSLSGNWSPLTSTYLNTFTQPIQAVYESLIQLDPATFEWEPLLAEEFEVSDDQLSMTLKLREDVSFTDGTHLDAAAAKKAFDYALTGPTHVVLRDDYLVEMEVTGEYELLVTSPKAMDPFFLLWFGLVPVVSPTAIETDPTALETQPVGTGPYILTEQVPETSVTFERNPDYWNPEAFPFDAVEFTIFADSVAAANALKSGQLNAALVDPSLAADVESNGFQLYLGAAPNLTIGWADRAGKVVSALTDVRVRKAIAFAFDREAIIENLEYGYGTVTSQVWGKGSPYYVGGADDTYAYDLDAARNLMAEAGYADGFAMRMPSYPDIVKYEPVIAQSLADIGITVEFDAYTDLASFVEAHESGEYALWFAIGGDMWTDVREYSPEIDALYEKVDHGTKQESVDALQEIGRIVLDDALMIAVSRPAEVWGTIPEIDVEPTLVNGWPVRLQGFGLVG